MMTGRLGRLRSAAAAAAAGGGGGPAVGEAGGAARGKGVALAAAAAGQTERGVWRPRCSPTAAAAAASSTQADDVGWEWGGAGGGGGNRGWLREGRCGGCRMGYGCTEGHAGTWPLTHPARRSLGTAGRETDNGGCEMDEGRDALLRGWHCGGWEVGGWGCCRGVRGGGDTRRLW